MSRKTKNFYAVAIGRQPGVYTEWFGQGGAAEQVLHFPGAVYKGFATLREANRWLKMKQAEPPPPPRPPPEEFSLEGLPEQPPSELPPLPRQAGWKGKDSFSPSALRKRVAELLEDGAVVLFTDGGASNWTGRGGYGVILKYADTVKELSAGYRSTTSNRMELMACLAGLQALERPSKVVVFCDSQYVVKGIAQGWAKRWRKNGWMRTPEAPAKNADLWRELLELCAKHEVEFHRIEGHHHSPDNERCDQLATEASRQADLPHDFHPKDLPPTDVLGLPPPYREGR